MTSLTSVQTLVEKEIEEPGFCSLRRAPTVEICYRAVLQCPGCSATAASSFININVAAVNIYLSSGALLQRNEAQERLFTFPQMELLINTGLIIEITAG